MTIRNFAVTEEGKSPRALSCDGSQRPPAMATPGCRNGAMRGSMGPAGECSWISQVRSVLVEERIDDARRGEISRLGCTGRASGNVRGDRQASFRWAPPRAGRWGVLAFLFAFGDPMVSSVGTVGIFGYVVTIAAGWMDAPVAPRTLVLQMLPLVLALPHGCDSLGLLIRPRGECIGDDCNRRPGERRRGCASQ